MRKFLSALLAVSALLVWVGGASAANGFSNLDPDGRPNLHERVPINFVFVGYEPGQVDAAEFLAELPEQYRPVVRSRLWYGNTEYLGLNYTYDYKVVYASSAYENRFFSKLSSLAQPAPRTLFQELYNEQETNVIDVGQNHFIDAPSVEKWLATNTPAGVDTRRNTVYFVNWWGRPDFKFHVYTKFGEPDPDTGFDFGMNRQTRRIIAWGGTAPDDEETGTRSSSVRRVWFYDLSAGPESWTDNWNVDDPDLDGDGVVDYRMPPVWEYLLPGGHRPAEQLDNDLGMVGRFVYINLLATSSPLYPPYLTPPRQPISINLDSNTFEGWPGVDASREYITPPLLLDETQELLRNVRVTYDNQDVPLTGKALECFLGTFESDPPSTTPDTYRCYPEYPNPPYPSFANLFLYGALNRASFVDGQLEYEPLFQNYASEGTEFTPLGFADDNWIDGTQSFVFNFVDPFIVQAGYGLTTTQIHEGGHHWGMSHPHDGYDYELDIDYGPSGPFYFAWSGDESNSMMSYIDVNWDFSQFDRDNYQRFGAAAYILNANAIAADVLESSNSFAGMDELESADNAIGASARQLRVHNYTGAYDSARTAYLFTRKAAREAGVTIVPSQNGWVVVPPSGSNGATRVSKKRYAYDLGRRENMKRHGHGH